MFSLLPMIYHGFHERLDLSSGSHNILRPSVQTNEVMNQNISHMKGGSRRKKEYQGCMSLLLPRLLELPSQCCSDGPGNLGDLGSNEEM